MVAVSNVMGIQVLFPKGKVNIVTLCCAIGAVVDLVLNLCLIPSLSYIGTSIAYIGAEVATTVTMYIIGRKYIPITFFKKNHFAYLLGCVVMAFVLLCVQRLGISNLQILLVQGCLGVLIYGATLYFFKDSLLMQIVSKVKR